MRHSPLATGSSAEALEPRRLLSAEVVNGTLVVVDTAGPDGIHLYEFALEETPYSIIVSIGHADGSGESYRFPSADVHGIVIRAGAGDDHVDFFRPSFPGTRHVRVPARIDAGIGDDEINGTKQNDFIVGGFGNDTIFGSDGNDWIDGGWGDDFLDGQDGNDVVSGGRGNDTVYGRFGDDRLFGGPGNDHVGFNSSGPLASEPGNDVLSGGSGDDWMVGGQGSDRIAGGIVRDHFSVEDADSEILDRTSDEPKDVPKGV